MLFCVCASVSVSGLNPVLTSPLNKFDKPQSHGLGFGVVPALSLFGHRGSDGDQRVLSREVIFIFSHFLQE